MCSISGLFSLKNELTMKDKDHLKQIIINAEDRGRDSFGIVSILEDKVDINKFIGKPSSVLDKINLPNSKIIINNNRAEPTTEYIKEKKIDDIQPFESFNGRIFLAHNGTIANDEILKNKYKLKTKTKIDSSVLAEYLSNFWDGEFNSLAEILKEEIIGSYSLAIYDKEQKDCLYLATNYKPLYIEKKDDVIYFTSLETYLNPGNISTKLNKNIVEIPPYTLIKIKDEKIEQLSLWKNNKIKKVLVICSGGLDSTVVATKYVRDGYDVELLHFRYKCRAESKEERSILDIANILKCKYTFIDTDIFKNIIKNSRLTETKNTISTEKKGKSGAELALEWVPARNLIMLSIATGYAEAYGYDIIALGNNLEESGAYPDNEMIFINKFNAILPFATNLQKRVRLEMPIGNLMKHEIVKLGLKLNAPLDKTWSCYNNEKYHCGKCGPCFMRKNAFKMNNKKDIIDYLC